MWSGNFRMAISSLRMTKWRSILTMLGIIIGVSSVITVVSLGEGLKHQIVGQIDNLGSDVITVRSGKVLSQDSSGQTTGLNLLAFLSSSTLTTRDVSALGQLPDVSTVVPMDFVTNSVSSGKNHMDNVYVIGTSPQMPDLLHTKLNYGGFFELDSTDENYAVIGPAIAQNLFKEYNPVGDSLIIDGQAFMVRGVLAPTAGGLLSIAQTDFNSAVFIPFTPAQTLTAGHTNLLQILVKAKDKNSVDKAVAETTSSLKRLHGQQDFSVLKQYELLHAASNAVNSASGIVSGIAAVSLLVGGIGIMDIMLVSVSERTREIGVRKALGASNRQILNQFLTEGLVLTIGGGLIGLVASLIINQLLRLYTNWQPIINWRIAILSIVISIIVGVVFSIAPALKAARKDPIEALRG